MDRPPYDSTPETPNESVGHVLAFLKSPNGLLKIFQMVVSIVIFIIVAIPYAWSSHSSGGFLNAVAALTFTATALFSMAYLCNAFTKFNCPWVLFEFGTRLISLLLWLIAFIVAAASYGFAGGSAVAAAIFSLVATALYAVELGLRFRVKRPGGKWNVTVTDVQNFVTYNAGTPSGSGGMPGAPYPADASSIPHTTFAGDAPGVAYSTATRTDQGYMMP